jgi:preprotein translocase subunit YajC
MLTLRQNVNSSPCSMTTRITAAPPTSAIPVFVQLLVFVLQMRTQQQQQQQQQICCH